MVVVPERINKKLLFWLETILGTGQAYQAFFKEPLK